MSETENAKCQSDMLGSAHSIFQAISNTGGISQKDHKDGGKLCEYTLYTY